MRRAEAEFASTTYERWRDSPKGVVSEQEREDKRAAFDSADAQLRPSEAQVALDQANVDQYQALFQFKQVRAVSTAPSRSADRHRQSGHRR